MKKTVFKILSVVLAVVMTSGCLGLDAVFAAAASYSVENATGYVGQTVSTTLTASNIAGLQSGVVVIEYDPNVLTFSSGKSYTITYGAIGLQSKLANVTDVLAAANYYPDAVSGKKYISYSFAANTALAAGDITRIGRSDLPLAKLFFTVKAKAAATTTLKIVKATKEVSEKITSATKTNATVTIGENPITAYDTPSTNDAKQYTNVSVSAAASGATAAAFAQTDTAGISSKAFAKTTKLQSLTFTAPVIDKSSKKDPAKPAEYPQAAFKALTQLTAAQIDLAKSDLAASRFFTDDGVIYIRDVDASGKLLDTCKVYLIPCAHAKTVYLSDNVTGFWNDDALCGKKVTDYTFNHNKHYDGKSAVTTAPTCTEAGVRTYTCAFCTKETRTESVAPIGHKWGAWKITTKPVCEAEGVETRVCQNDKTHKETRSVAALGHNWSEWAVTTAPTCTEDGVETRVCGNDGSHQETRPVAALGHEFGEWKVTKAPTCEEPGVETRYCVHDKKHTETREIAPIGHEWGEWTVTTAPTCEEPGVETRYCVHDKKHTETREVAPIGHEWGEWTLTKAPTCEEPGVETRVCLHDDSHTETREVAATGHNWGEWEITLEPTCTEPGSRIRYCNNNKKHTETQEVPALGHTWQNEETLKSATCREEGLRHHDCAVCGFEEDYAYSDANAHIWVQDGTNFWGTPKWKCTVCGEEIVQRDKPGSSYVEITTEPPTTEAPTTEAPTTEAPTTEAPTTEAPTTEAPTTEAPTVPSSQLTIPSSEPTVPSSDPTVPSSDPTVPSVPDQTEPQVFYRLGDVDMNGKINSADARLTLRAAAKVEPFSDLQNLLGDVVEDGKIKAADARMILRIAARLEPQPEKMIPATA